MRAPLRREVSPQKSPNMIPANRGLLSDNEEQPHLRKACRPVFILPPKPSWRLLVEGFLLLLLGSIAVAAFAAMVFAITGL